jgi:DNA-binding GntR family transcriptional regulator
MYRVRNNSVSASGVVVSETSSHKSMKPRTSRQQLSEEVASYVRELILSGQVKQGDFLRLEPIAEALGISNTPVREGLLSLRGEGFVELVPRRGFVVGSFTQRDVEDLFWVQAMIAGELAARAAVNIKEEELEELEAINQRHRQAIEDGDLEAIAKQGHEFHSLINLAAHSARLSTLLGTTVEYLPNRFYASIDDQVQATLDAHPAILDALRRRSPLMARASMQDHIQAGAHSLVAQLTSRGIWDVEDDTVSA